MNMLKLTNEKKFSEIFNIKIFLRVLKIGKSKMNSKAASRIQSHADRTGRNQDFKSRAQRAAAKNKK